MNCIVHGVAKSQTRLRDFHFHFSHTHTHTHTRICISSKVAARNVFHSKVVFKEVLFVNN